MKNGDNQSTASRRTLIDEGTEIKGQIDSACAIVVMGKVEGGLTGPSLYVTETGTVSGSAHVKELASRGELAGEFDAETAELSGRARDRTVIRARSLDVSLDRGDGSAAMVFGDCELVVGDAPDKALAIRNATGTRAPVPEPAAMTAPAPEAPVPATATATATATAAAEPQAVPSSDAAAGAVVAETTEPTPGNKTGKHRAPTALAVRH